MSKFSKRQMAEPTGAYFDNVLKPEPHILEQWVGY